MFIITLRFANKERAPALMDRHNAWVKQGFDDGVFLLVGSIRPDGGGVIMAHNAPRAAIEARVQSDPSLPRASSMPTSSRSHQIEPKTDWAS